MARNNKIFVATISFWHPSQSSIPESTPHNQMRHGEGIAWWHHEVASPSFIVCATSWCFGWGMEKEGVNGTATEKMVKFSLTPGVTRGWVSVEYGNYRLVQLFLYLLTFTLRSVCMWIPHSRDRKMCFIDILAIFWFFCFLCLCDCPVSLA